VDGGISGKQNEVTGCKIPEVNSKLFLKEINKQ
jgi:hypothetical protein